MVIHIIQHHNNHYITPPPPHYQNPAFLLKFHPSNISIILMKLLKRDQFLILNSFDITHSIYGPTVIHSSNQPDFIFTNIECILLSESGK